MYIAVRRYGGVTDPEEAGRISNEGFLPIISEIPGLVAFYWVDAGDGVMVSTSVFERKEAEEESTFVAGGFVAEHLLPLLPNRPQITAGEVVVYKAKSWARAKERSQTASDRLGPSELSLLGPYLGDEA